MWRNVPLCTHNENMATAHTSVSPLPPTNQCTSLCPSNVSLLLSVFFSLLQSQLAFMARRGLCGSKSCRKKQPKKTNKQRKGTTGIH